MANGDAHAIHEAHYMATLPTNMGWQCPGCNKCYAPWVFKCEDCGSGSGFTVIHSNMTECPHIWGAQTTAGTFCINCGVQQTPPVPQGNTCSNEGVRDD